MFKKYTVYNEIPLVKITLLCIVGILIGIYFQSKTLNILFIISLKLSFFYLITYDFILKIKHKKYTSQIATIFSPIVFIGLGYFLSVYQNNSNNENYFSNYITSKSNYIEAKILDAPQEKKNSYKIIVDVEKVLLNKSLIETNGKLLLYFEKDDSVKKLKPNDKLYIHTKIKQLQNSKNPNEFDFSNYLAFQNIYYQSYVKTKNWKISSSSNNKISNTLYSIKSYLQEIINKNIFHKDERAVASALLLGNRTYLTDDILKAFSSSGATHILAVSGLHVGLFYGIISFLFGFLKKFKRFKILHPIIIITFIWFYVALTGGSPSVMRAATMFSFVAIGLAMSRYVNIYNIIAFSALIIISINPYIITEVGFQLSYFAVIGIIYLQSKIYKVFYIKNYLLDKLWVITSVSIAAQISTFPLIILYFHQFPNFFWLSNIVVIPAATIILYIGVVMFIFSFNEAILFILGNILSYIIKALNISLTWIEKIPYAVTDKLYISYFQAILFYLAIFTIVISIEQKSKKIGLAFICILALIFTTYHIDDYSSNVQNKLTVYHVPKYSAIEIIEGNEAYHKIDSTLLLNDDLMTFRIKHNWWQQRINKQNFNLNCLNSIYKDGLQLIMYETKKIGIIDSKFETINLNLDLEYLIVSHTPNLKLKQFSSKVKVKTYIFDTSNEKYKEKYWKKDCKDLNLNCYFVSDTSAFIIEF